MTDLYPTRLNDFETFSVRFDPIVWTDAHSDDLAFYKRNGYLVIEKFWPVIIDSLLMPAFDLLGEPPQSDTLTSLEPNSAVTRAILGVDRLWPFSVVSSDPRLTELVRSILGDDTYVHQSRINYKLGIGTTGWRWHSDFETWHAQDGMPTMRCLTAMIPLVENTGPNGALMVIPGSHKYFWGSKKSTSHSAEANFSDQVDGVPTDKILALFLERCGTEIQTLVCSPGDLILFDCNTLHGSAPNMTPHSRANLFVVYNSVFNRLVAPFSCEKPRPVQMAMREPA
ncbi:MAG: phytanoyl-CoA dioxygenase family protein [Blastocatellia bacterium]|nr:phytanoyl-CoA dioxygenase family protein [Blastocatellia bacterium]